MREYATRVLSNDLLSGKEGLIQRAVTERLGSCGNFLDIAPRLNQAIYPDGSETITLDGVDLVYFLPVEYSHGESEKTVTFRATVKYRIAK